MKEETICVRLLPQLKTAFIEECKHFGETSEIHRELLQAFVDGRLTISKTDNPKFYKLYEELK